MKSKKFKTTSEKVLKHPVINDCLIFDTETNSLNTETGDVKFVGFYSYKYEKYMMFDMTEREQIQKLIDEHRILIGFNNIGFDAPMMTNIVNNFNMEFKIQFDCMNVLYDFKRRRVNREAYIKMPNGKPMSSMPNRRLKTVAESLGFPSAKGDIDYKIFKQETWTEQELKDIYIYLYHDVEITRMFFEYLVDYFDPYTEYVPEDNIRKFNYIRSSFGAYAYSAICHLTGLPIEYESDPNKLLIKPENHGGFVLDPQVPFAENTMYLDFSSLYPNIMVQCNLFSSVCDCCSDDEKWTGGDFFEINGKYCSKKIGRVEKTLRDIYLKRKKYKEIKDPREQALKVLLNTTYGIGSSPIFKSLFNMYIGGDCTSIGRKCLEYTQQRFNEEGFNVVYGDTDSVFVQIPSGKTQDGATVIANKIVEEIQSNMPFPW